MAVCTTFLIHRTLVRCGLHEGNATLTTLVIVLSPVFVPLTFSFMTDVSGVFAIVLCLYACLRAIQATDSNAAAAWVSFAALSNGFLGSVRQIAWLGVLVMVPCAIWILRRIRRVLVIGSITCVVGIITVFATMQWFYHQPFSVRESPMPDFSRPHFMRIFVDSALHGAAELVLLVLPLLLLFLVPPQRHDRHKVAWFCLASFVPHTVGRGLSRENW